MVKRRLVEESMMEREVEQEVESVEAREGDIEGEGE